LEAQAVTLRLVAQEDLEARDAAAAAAVAGEAHRADARLAAAAARVREEGE
jgi:hypothetical protein